jgi:CBS domain-containing protein
VQQHSVRDLMRIRHGLVVTEATTLREVAERLIINDCDLVAVTDERGKLTGVVCESSIVRALLTNPAADVSIQSIVIRHVESVRLDANLAAVQPLFRSCANTAIPVVDASGVVCGLLMRTDVIRSLLNRNTELAETANTAGSPAVASPPAVTGLINPAMAFTPPKKRTIHAGEAAKKTEGNQPRPHFLRSDAARRLLWPAEDRL